MFVSENVDKPAVVREAEVVAALISFAPNV